MGKRTRSQLIVMLLIMSILMITGCGKDKVTSNRRNIAVITKSTSSTFFELLFDGAYKAAEEYDVDVTCEGPDNENDYLAQNEMIEMAMENEVGAIVISAIDKDKSTKILQEAKNQGIYVVVIDSGINSNLVEASIETDNYDAGKKMAEALLLEGDVSCEKIGIVNFNGSSANILEREKGFVSVVEEHEESEIVGQVYVGVNVGEAKKAALQLIDEHEDIDVIVTFNEWTTLGVGYAVKERELQNEIEVIGFDSNVISVSMLESGEIDGLIVQNPYEIGYLGVEVAYQLMNGNALEETEIITDIKYITRENMNEESSQKILFPLE